MDFAKRLRTIEINGQSYETTDEDRRVLHSAVRSLAFGVFGGAAVGIMFGSLVGRRLGRVIFTSLGGVVGLYAGSRIGAQWASDRLWSLPDSPLRDVAVKLNRRIYDGNFRRGFILGDDVVTFDFNRERSRRDWRQSKLRIIAETPEGRKEWSISGPGVEGKTLNITTESGGFPTASDIEGLFQRKAL
ncbi:hypothetical protein HK105_205159 [Polyrhizophydium stewartii]|uniref:Uncharacterized protein n=1 Tax=Polyrhizophydium stewartii TaxID=2732419 RepID=A0ABR4N722_9FUNG